MKIKSIIIAAGLCAGNSLQAQDLASRIPEKATAVVSVKGNRLLDLLSVEEFNKSVPGKKLLQHASESGTEYHSLEDFGIQVSGTDWYYYIATDSISYHCLLLPLSSAARFEQFFNKEGKDNIVHNGARRSMVTPGSDHFLLWDDQSALLISGSLNDRFFRDSANAERYGVKEVSYSDYYYRESEAPYTAETVTVDTAMAYDATTDVATAVEEAPEEKPEPPMPVEVAPVEEKTPEPDIAGEPTATDPGQIDPPPPPVSYSNHNTSAYNKAYEEQRKIKKDLAQKWTAAFAENKFGNSTTTSILNNPAYQRSQDKEAVATFYLSDLSGLYSGILPYYYGRYTNGVLSGFKSMNARLYLDREEARVVSELEVDENKATSYKKMYSKKVNKKFLKYINSDKLIGFMSYAINTEAYLQEVPGLLENTYGRYLDKYEEEIGLGAELFSLLLDEKAVAKVIKGDALLLFTDISPQKHTYKTYEYDDNYERKEIERTKTETLPDFLFMMSSEDTHLLERALRYGIRKEAITEKNGIYTLNKKWSKSPFDLHLLIKDGIIFCGTSYHDIQQISTDHFQSNVSAEQKSLIRNNNFSVYLNPKNVVGKISEQEFGSSRKLKEFNTFMGNIGPFFARSTGIKNNRISGEMVAVVPEGKENALKYFFSLIELMNKFD